MGRYYRSGIFNWAKILKKYVKDYGFLSFERKFSNKYGKKLMDISAKTGIDTAKTASKK